MQHQNDIIVKMYTDGVPSPEIAKSLGIRTQTLYHRMRKLGLSPGKNRSTFGRNGTDIPSKEDREAREQRIVSARLNGMTLSEIAELEFGDADKNSSVSRILRKHGLTNSRYHDTEKRDEKIRALHANGMSVAFIAETCEMSQSNVYRILGAKK